MSSDSGFLLSINDIMNSRETLVATEETNKATLTSLDFNLLKTNLYTWASKGYPDSYVAFSFPIISPGTTNGALSCSDGNSRNIWDYIPFFLGKSVSELFESYQAQIHGITLTYSLQASPFIMNMHVTRA